MKRIIAGFFIFEILVVIWIFTRRKLYRSELTILSPEAEVPQAVLKTPFGPLQNPSNLSSNTITSQAIVALLESRRMARRVVEYFKLDTLYHARNEIESIKKFLKNLQVNWDLDRGVITVVFISPYPRLCKDVLDYMLVSLDTLNRVLKLTTRKPIVKVIDPPQVPVRKYKPRLSFNLIIGAFVYMSLITGLYIVREFFKFFKF